MKLAILIATAATLIFAIGYSVAYYLYRRRFYHHRQPRCLTNEERAIFRDALRASGRPSDIKFSSLRHSAFEHHEAA